MSHTILAPRLVTLSEAHAAQRPATGHKVPQRLATATLAASITRASSLQTYLTIRYLVDAPLVDDAYRAYAYFRWVDDALDAGQNSPTQRLAFVARQQQIIRQCYLGQRPENVRPEESLVVDLIHNNLAGGLGLRIYIDQMMNVMAFDANRKGRHRSEAELAQYTRSLAVAVTEALHYFIGHDDASPQDASRYQAVTGAHITHMLRDAIEDAAAGYTNIPRSYLERHGITPTDVDHDAYRAWVARQVKSARNYFAAGRRYLARVENWRCRLAGYAYIARFEYVLDAIENEGYRLRAAYPERKSGKARLNMLLSALTQTMSSPFPAKHAPTPGLAPSAELIK